METKENDPVKLDRYFATVADLDKRYEQVEAESNTTSFAVKCQKFSKALLNRVPIIDTLKTYNFRKMIFLDILAGVAVIGLHFPQGLAYGLLAGLTPNIGMVSTIVPVLLYLIFGSSPHVSIGTNAIASIIVSELFLESKIVDYLKTIKANADTDNITLNNGSTQTDSSTIGDIDELVMKHKASLIAGITFYAGIIFLIMAIFKMGFLVTYLSQSFMSGFTTGVAVHIFSSQIKSALGITSEPSEGIGKLPFMYYRIFKNIETTNVGMLIVTLICVTILLSVKILVNEKFKLKKQIPIDFILLIVATVISYFTDLQGKYQIKTLGKIDMGIPTPQLPILQPVGLLLLNAIEVVLVTFFLNIAITKIIATNNAYDVDENVETCAYGMVNIVSSFFSCIPASIAPPRAVLLSSMGAKSTLNAISTSVIMFALIFFVGQYFESCPRPVLASMVMVAMKDLLKQVTVLPKLWRVSKNDFTIWTIAAVTTIFMEIPYGLALGVLVSLISVVNQSQRGRVHILEKSTTEDLYLDTNVFSGVKEIPGIKIIRIESSLYFATAANFRKTVLKVVQINDEETVEDVDNNVEMRNMNSNTPRITLNGFDDGIEIDEMRLQMIADLKNADQTEVLIIDCIPINFIDVTGLDILKLVILELGCSDISVYLARCSRYMLRLLEKSDIFECFPREHVFVDVPDAVAAAMAVIKDNKENSHAQVEDVIQTLLRTQTVVSISSMMVEIEHDPSHDHHLDRHYHTIH